MMKCVQYNFRDVSHILYYILGFISNMIIDEDKNDIYWEYLLKRLSLEKMSDTDDVFQTLQEMQWSM